MQDFRRVAAASTLGPLVVGDKVQKYADLLAAHHLSGNYYAPHQYFSTLNQ